MKVPVPYTEEEAFDIQERLDTKLDASHLSYRPAAQGTVAYLEGWKAFNLANEVFGFNGWSSEILSFTIDFVRTKRGNKAGKWEIIPMFLINALFTLL